MTETLEEVFSARRTRLLAVAHRILGSSADAEDAVQEAWIRVQRAGTEGVENLDAWLTTVVGRISLDQLRARRPRDGAAPAEPAAPPDPAEEVEQADVVGAALLTLLDLLAPAERLAFVLHDLFDVPFEDIAPLVRRSPAATRQLASRARRRIRGVPVSGPGDATSLVTAFLRASRSGDFADLLRVLDPDVVLTADAAAQAFGAPAEAFGADGAVRFLRGRAGGAVPALVDGEPGAIWAVDGVPRVVFKLALSGGRISAVHLLADPARVASLELGPVP